MNEVAIFACTKGCKNEKDKCAYRKMYPLFEHKIRVFVNDVEDYESYWDAYENALRSPKITSIKCFNCTCKHDITAVKSLDVIKLGLHQEGGSHERNVNCTITAAPRHDSRGIRPA